MGSGINGPPGRRGSIAIAREAAAYSAFGKDVFPKYILPRRSIIGSYRHSENANVGDAGSSLLMINRSTSGSERTPTFYIPPAVRRG
jgi:hypothetical protein